MLMRRCLLTGLISIAGLWSMGANADVINAVDQGWWNGADNSNNINPNANTFSGLDGFTRGSNVFRSYFVFDLTGVSTVGAGSTILLNRLRYFSTQASETFNIYDVSTNINTLRTAANNAGTYADLGSGNVYGSFTVGLGDQGNDVLVNLTAAAIADINANLGGFFAVGVSSQTQGDVVNDGIRFDGSPHQLDLTIGPPDSDDDGVPDDEDACPDSNLTATIVIDDCDSGVANLLFEDGCTMADMITECADGAVNHGQFVSCVAHLTNEWKRAGLITGEEEGRIQSCAARSDIPGDLDGDGAVGVADLVMLLGEWGPCPGRPDTCPADVDLDDIVGISDLLILLGNWG